MPEVTDRVKKIQASMIESAKPYFDETSLGYLRCLIRLAVEFQEYLEHGSVELATSVLGGPYAKYVPDAKEASTDPFNRYDLDYACKSIQSGVPSFCGLSASCSLLSGVPKTAIEWGMTSSRESFKSQFVSMFRKFSEEAHFETKCRLLLDLFKLQIVFAGMSYDS